MDSQKHREDQPNNQTRRVNMPVKYGNYHWNNEQRHDLRLLLGGHERANTLALNPVGITLKCGRLSLSVGRAMQNRSLTMGC